MTTGSGWWQRSQPPLLQHGDGGFAGPVGPGRASGAWCAPVAASGRLPPSAVEVVPSREAAVLLPPSLLSPFSVLEASR